MNCAEIKNYITSAVDGVLAVSERKVLDEHLTHCPACAAELEQYRALQRVVHDWASDIVDRSDPGDAINKRVMTAVANRLPGNAVRIRNQYRITLLWSAVFLAVTTACGFVVRIPAPKLDSSWTNVLPTRLAIDLTQPIQQILANFQSLANIVSSKEVFSLTIGLVVVLAVVNILLYTKPSGNSSTAA